MLKKEKITLMSALLLSLLLVLSGGVFAQENGELTKLEISRELVEHFNYDVPAEIEEPTFSNLEGENLAYAEAALRAGIIDEDFDADDAASREEAASMLINAMRIKAEADQDILDKFEDRDQIDSEFTSDVALAVELGLFVGYAEDEFAADEGLRSENLEAVLDRLQNSYQQIDVLSTNDFHGKVEAGEEPGAAKLMAAIDHYRSANPRGTVLVDSGDSYQGTPISSLNDAEPVIKFMNDARYVAQAVGNHEFDWGIDELIDINERTYFPLMAANIVNQETGELVEWAEPTRMIPVGGIKLGIIGIATPDTKGTTMPSYVEDLEFTDPTAAINKYAEELKNNGAEMIVVVSHMPGTTDEETGEVSGELIDTARGVEAEIAGISGGHSHHTVAAVVNDISVVEANKHGRKLGNLRFYVDKETKEIYKAEPMVHPVQDSIIDLKEDQETDEMVASYQEDLEDKMSEVLIETDEMMESKYDDIFRIGALTTDAMSERSGADIAFQNPGGLRIDLPAGEITVGQIFELLPFGNTIVTGEMTGEQIVSILEQSFTFDKGMMQLSGLQVEYDPDQPEYERVVSVSLADGSPLEMDKKYTVATNNFLAEGGDGFETFTEVDFEDSYTVVRDAVIEYLREKEELDLDVDGRVEEADKSAALRIRYAA